MDGNRLRYIQNLSDGGLRDNTFGIEHDLTRILESAKRFGIEMDEFEAL